MGGGGKVCGSDFSRFVGVAYHIRKRTYTFQIFVDTYSYLGGFNHKSVVNRERLLIYHHSQ